MLDRHFPVSSADIQVRRDLEDRARGAAVSIVMLMGLGLVIPARVSRLAFRPPWQDKDNHGETVLKEMPGEIGHEERGDAM